jgi:hypothetical protein
MFLKKYCVYFGKNVFEFFFSFSEVRSISQKPSKGWREGDTNIFEKGGDRS